MTASTRNRVLIALAFLALAVTVGSVTVGRDLYSGRAPDLGSFALVNFAGYLFFLVMPVEVLVPWYLAEGHAGAVVASLAVLTGMGAQVVDYGIGRLASDKLVTHLIGERRLRRARGTIERYGRWAIFAFNLTPLSSPSIVAAAGVVGFGFARTMLWSVLGLVLKYVALVWVF